MSDHLLRTVAEMEAEVAIKEIELLQLKTMINFLCARAGVPGKFEESALAPTAPRESATIAPDRFHGRKLNTAITDYLSTRKSMNPNAGPAAAEEIHAVLLQGGYTFDQSKKDEQLHSLKTSLGKSSHTFRKLPNGTYGLSEWYERTPKRTKRAPGPIQPLVNSAEPPFEGEEATAGEEPDTDEKDIVF